MTSFRFGDSGILASSIAKVVATFWGIVAIGAIGFADAPQKPAPQSASASSGKAVEIGLIGNDGYSMYLHHKAAAPSSTPASGSTPDDKAAFGTDSGMRAWRVGTHFDGVSFGIVLTSNSSRDDPPEAKLAAGNFHSTYTGGDLSYFSQNWGVAGSYGLLNGMQLQSITGVEDATLAKDPASYRRDIKLTGGSFDFWYLPFAANMDLNAFMDMTSKPHGCGIALAWVTSYDSIRLDMTSPLMANTYAADYGNESQLTHAHVQTVSAKIGPIASLEWAGFFASVFTGIGIMEQLSYTVAGKQTGDESFDNVSQVVLSAGYKGQHWSLALNGQARSVLDIRIDTQRVDFQHSSVFLSLGYHF